MSTMKIDNCTSMKDIAEYLNTQIPGDKPAETWCKLDTRLGVSHCLLMH